MVITPYGGVRRRAGFSYVETAPTECRLFSFQASIDQGYILEFSEETIRFYRRDSLVQATGGGDYEVATPYAIEDLAGLQMAQINSVAYVTHPDHPVYKLSRIANANWTFAAVEWDYPAMLEENLKRSRKLTTSAAGDEGDTIKLNASWSIFDTSHVGSYFEVSHERGADQFEVELEATSGNDGLTSDELIVQGDWNLTTRGTWTGTFEIQRNSGSGWSTIRKFTSAADANYSTGGSEPSRVLMRLKWIHGSSGSSTPKAILEASGAYIRGLVKITKVHSDIKATVEVISAVEAGATSYWRESAWSARRGYPRTVAAHEQRLMFAGNRHRPQTVWASAVDDYENFQPGTEDADSWSHTLVSGQQNDIQWLISQKSLLVGTSGDEWVISATKEEAIITPTNVRARRHSGNGSDFIRARVIDDSALFIQRGGRVLRELAYSFEADGYKTTDLTLLAEHITGEGIIETAWQLQPESVLWCVTRDGRLLGLTYDKGQNVYGWHRHTTGGAADGFESVAVKQVEGEADQVWVSVRRTIDGTVRRYIERLKPDGFFLEDPWDTLFADPLGVEIWDYKFNSYEVGDIRSYDEAGSRAYLCIEAHDMDATWAGSGFYTHAALNYDSPGGLEWVRVYNWADGEGTSDPFNVGQLCHHNGDIYRAILNSYETDPDSEPGVGVDWALYWEVFTPYPALPDPLVDAIYSEKYFEDDEVAHGGFVYRCIADHFPATTNEPGVGASWGTYWEIVQDSYVIGDKVSAGGVNYICTADHTPTEDDKPGTGANWGDYWETIPTDNLIYFVDSGVSLINPGEITEMTGLDHLEGETVQVVANGAVLPERVVTAGAIQFDQEGDPTTFTDVCAGLAFESILEPMALEVGMQNGTSVSREKRIHELVIFFKDSYGCKVSDRLTGTFDTLRFYDTEDANSPTLFTGPITHMLDSRHDMEASFVLKQDLPMPMQILAVVPKFNVYGDNS